VERLYRVRTPEMVEFTFPVAGLASRFLAWAIDATVIVLLCGIAALVLLFGAFVLAFANPNLVYMTFAVGLFVFFALQWGYFVFWEATWDGRTPGKRALGLRTISDTGVRMTVAQAAIRNLFRFLDALPALTAPPVVTYVLGSLSHLASSAGQRIGDRFAGTVVVREERRSVPSRIGFPEAKYNSFLEDPALATRIARTVRAEETEVLFELLLRRDELALATRGELFATLARHLEQRLDLPKERFLSDEKLVMNIAQAVVHGTEGGVSSVSHAGVA
jgi:uncharacterized RDD family membrane protein YckC